MYMLRMKLYAHKNQMWYHDKEIRGMSSAL